MQMIQHYVLSKGCPSGESGSVGSGPVGGNVGLVKPQRLPRCEVGPDLRGGGGGAQGEAGGVAGSGLLREKHHRFRGEGREETGRAFWNSGCGRRHRGQNPEGAPQGRGELAERVSGPAGHGEGLTA